MKNYYTISDAIINECHNKDLFMVANESKKKDGTIGRRFTVFPNFESFFCSRKKYPHCHELLVNHEDLVPNYGGRLVFDFDIVYKDNLVIPDNFKDQIEAMIISIITQYYVGVNTDIILFVWSSCVNATKLSKHLTVKNFYFDNLIPMSKQFYDILAIEWDKKYDWISSDDLFDAQIVRKNSSLRMTGSRKINGNVLTLDNKEFTLLDSLIRIYNNTHLQQEQIITSNNIIASPPSIVVPNIIMRPQIVSNYQNNNIDNMDVYEAAFNICNNILPGIFKMGKIIENRIDLTRIGSYKCLMSDHIHEKQNAYLILDKVNHIYQIKFGCYRYCNKNYSLCHIGDVLATNYDTECIEPIIYCNP